ncbi:MAG TPA: restriction endonuclease subunit S [Thermoanaerobaculia bacterium]|nr:restriction endonuclease subunit S [Thermoanaerobaculia bacterium]
MRELQVAASVQGLFAPPQDWALRRLGEVARVVGGGTPRRDKPEFWGGGIPWATPTDITRLRSSFIEKTASTLTDLGLKSCSASLVPSGSVLVTARATIGFCAVTRVPMATNQGCQSLVPTRATSAEFLYYLLRYRGNDLVKLSAGSTFPEISRHSMRSLEILLPPPAEQTEIVRIISSVDNAIGATQAVIEQARVVKNAMLPELLSRGIPGRHTSFKETQLGAMPAEWQLVSYRDLAANVPGAIQSGPFGSELRHSEFGSEGILVIGIDNVLDGRFSLGANHRISVSRSRELSRFLARPLDLLITVMASVGRCCVVPADLEPAIITKHVYRLSVDQSRADPFFLMHCIYGLARLASALRGSAQGLSRPGLNKSLLLPLCFPLPPLEEQQEIVALMAALDRRIEAEKQVLSRLAELKAALLAALLSGEIRVTLDEVPV